MNDFSKLSAEDEASRFAQLTPEEIAEANAYYDSLAAEFNKQFEEWHGDSDGTVGVD